MSDNNIFSSFNDGVKFSENISKLGFFYWECLFLAIILGVYFKSFAAGIVFFFVLPFVIHFLASNRYLRFAISAAFSLLWGYVVYSLSISLGASIIWSIPLGVIGFLMSMGSHYKTFSMKSA